MCDNVRDIYKYETQDNTSRVPSQPSPDQMGQNIAEKNGKIIKDERGNLQGKLVRR